MVRQRLDNTLDVCKTGSGRVTKGYKRGATRISDYVLKRKPARQKPIRKICDKSCGENFGEVMRGGVGVAAFVARKQFCGLVLLQSMFEFLLGNRVPRPLKGVYLRGTLTEFPLLQYGGSLTKSLGIRTQSCGATFIECFDCISLIVLYT